MVRNTLIAEAFGADFRHWGGMSYKAPKNKVSEPRRATGRGALRLSKIFAAQRPCAVICDVINMRPCRLTTTYKA
jgi:hypothetical protein